VDQFGYGINVLSLSSDPEIHFDYQSDKSKPGGYHTFDIRYLVLPDYIRTKAPATLISDVPPYALYEVNGSSPTYTTLVDTMEPPVLGVNNSNIGEATGPILDGVDLQKGIYHTIEFNGVAAAMPSWSGLGLPSGTPGVVTSEQADLNHGDVVVSVAASRQAVALLSASYDNRWTATVDGAAVPTQMIAPSLVGVAVAAGTHTVEFKYQPYPFYWFWLLVGLGAAVALRSKRLVLRGVDS
jgi:hypothetical protein